MPDRRPRLLEFALTLPLLAGAACSSEEGPPARAPDPTPAVSGVDLREDAPRVVFLGDSIAAGLHLAADRAFPAVIQRALAAEGRGFELVNAGISGDTSAGGLRRLDWLLAQDPAVVVVELGANDGLRGIPLASIRANLDAILTRIRAHGARVLLLGMRLPPNYGDYAAGFEALYAELAREHDVAFLPFFMEGVAGVAELNLPDGIHPTEEGHRRLAERVAPALGELLSALGD